jgi:hypothetical protein
MHRHGLIHGYVRAESIFLEFESGRALLADFGVARRPAGELPVDARSDLYRLGLVGREIVGRDMAPGLGRVIERAVSNDPAARWPTGDDFAAQLRSVERGSLRRRVSHQGQQVVERVRASGAWAVGRDIIEHGHDLAARVGAWLRVNDMRPRPHGVVSRATWLVAGGLVVLLLLGDEHAPVAEARATPVSVPVVSAALVSAALVGAPAVSVPVVSIPVVSVPVVSVPVVQIPAAMVRATVEADDAMRRVYRELEAAFEPGARRELGHAQAMWQAGRDRVCRQYTRPDARMRCEGKLSRRRVTELTELLARVRGQALAHPAGGP